MPEVLEDIPDACRGKAPRREVRQVTAPDPRVGEIEAKADIAGKFGIRFAIETSDVAYLLAELRKAREALARVEALAAAWTARGEHDMAFSKTIPDEDIAMVLLTEGASMVENGRHIRNAIKGES